jgi:MerR family transcriptional regulator, copper efflux regulator
MRIGELARKAEVNIQTVRYYERKRLLRAPARTSGGYRSYLASDLEHLRFIKWCQRLGFTLREIRGLLPLHTAVAERSATDRQELRGLQDLLASKRSDIEGRIAALRKLSRQLGKALEVLSAAREPVCPAAKLGSPTQSRWQTRGS